MFSYKICFSFIRNPQLLLNKYDCTNTVYTRLFNVIRYQKHSTTTATTAKKSTKITSNLDTNIPDHSTRTITVRTCGNGLYQQLKSLYPGLYPRHVPNDGVSLTVTYADSALDDTVNKTQSYDKVVVAIPGTLGHYNHFRQLFNHFRHTNTRVVVIAMPEFRHTLATNHLYWSTVPERLAFIKDFLRALSITQVDCLLTHSLGALTVGAFFDQPDEISIKSTLLCAPQPLWEGVPGMVTNMKFIKPFFWIRSNIWYRLLSAAGVHQSKYWRLRMGSIEDVYSFLLPALDTRSLLELHRHLFALRDGTIPHTNAQVPAVAVLYGSKESFMPKSTIKQFNEELGIKVPEQIQMIDAQVIQPQELHQTNRIMSYMIEGGGHFVHGNYALYANRIVENLLNYHDL